MKNITDTTKMEVRVLDGIKGMTEGLYGVGALSDEEAQRADDLRRTLGAKPLNLRRFDGASVTETPPSIPRLKALRKREGLRSACSTAAWITSANALSDRSALRWRQPLAGSPGRIRDALKS